jgi:predicted 3-demethylubiquinone-9 3-methyltransferase (glyoxalase superfamily)
MTAPRMASTEVTRAVGVDAVLTAPYCIQTAADALSRPATRCEVFMATTQRIRPCLWFDDQAEQAARFYTGIFKNSRIVRITRYGNAGFEIHHRPAGTVMTVEFEIDGQKFTALNGGPEFQFNEAISLEVYCDTQDEIDYYWEKLSAGGDPKAQVCGWLKDKYGLSWQVVPTLLTEMLTDEKSEQSQRAFAAMLQMKKLDIAALKNAYEGGVPVG